MFRDIVKADSDSKEVIAYELLCVLGLRSGIWVVAMLL